MKNTYENILQNKIVKLRDLFVWLIKKEDIMIFFTAFIVSYLDIKNQIISIEKVYIELNEYVVSLEDLLYIMKF